MDYFEVGKIVNTVGVKGEIKVFPTTDDMRRFDLLDEITIEWPDGRRETRPVEKVRYHRNLVMLRLNGVNDAEAAAKFKGSTIVVSREQALPLGEGEFYVPDLIGMAVISDEGRELGVLSDVLMTGANDVYVVKQPGVKEILIPAIEQCILNVDLENKTMTVHLLEGLL
ncbi:MAG: ribosome maturation factor RimM [Clostridiales bacterium]|jgi:16S rRNA processing protein RimM|nr:ribosome maturation factor RimM [Clostridiales bacterium]